MKSIQPLLLLVATAVLAVAVGLRPGSTQAQEEIACETEATVQADDWLSKIAEKAYGDLLLYPALVAATNAQAATDSSYTVIDDPDLIEPGWKICVPSLAEAQALVESDLAASNPALLSSDALQNATYSSIYEEPVTLTEGRYEGEPFAEGFSDRPIVQYINNSELYGDLNGDGVEDAVVFLVESSGGTGNFVYVAAQLNQNGQPVDAGAVLLEDRIQVKSTAIENGQINLEITAEGPGDAACCKSHKTNTSYALQDGLLTEIPGEDQTLERISAADLNGTSWTLLELDYDQPALANTGITISFADGQISGSGGCNTYNSSFTLGDDNPFVMSISPVVATQQACPEPILSQETAYFSALENVSLWGYDIGRLAMNYFEELQSGPRRLLFAPAARAEASQVNRLMASTWHWVGFTDPVQQFEIDNPENYTLSFQPDGTLQIQADCNKAGAGYIATEEGTLSVAPGITTLALCPGDSRGEEFVQKLGFAVLYFSQDGQLFIDLMADGGTMRFRS